MHELDIRVDAYSHPEQGYEQRYEGYPTPEVDFVRESR
jgi:hypothetical protein